MVKGYAFQGFDEKDMVRVLGRNLPISKKASREVCHFIKHKDLNKMSNLLKKVQAKEVAIPFKRFRRDIAHKKGNIGPGRYPVKSVKVILDLLNSLKASANDKGLNGEGLQIIHTSVSPGPSLMHYGRHRGSKRKMCNIEIVAKELVKSSKKTKKKSAKTEKAKDSGVKKSKPSSKPKEDKKTSEKKEDNTQKSSDKKEVNKND